MHICTHTHSYAHVPIIHSHTHFHTLITQACSLTHTSHTDSHALNILAHTSHTDMHSHITCTLRIIHSQTHTHALAHTSHAHLNSHALTHALTNITCTLRLTSTH